MTEWTNDSVRELERDSIRRFVQASAEHFTGRVLDLGCGKQPYRDIIEDAGGAYVPYDRVRFAGNASGEDVGDELTEKDAGWFDTVLATQVIQYVDDPGRWLFRIALALKPGGTLVMSYPLCWDWVEPEDKWRFTPAGIADLLGTAGFTVMHSEERAAIELGGFRLPLGYGVIAHS